MRLQMEKGSTPFAKAVGLGRLTLLLLVSTLGVAGFLHVMYGVGLVTAVVVVAEIGVIVILAFLYAWRSAR
jgi:hypothetical protein